MNIPYQLHITCHIEAGQVDDFARACAELGGKATIIELSRGNLQFQPMFTKVVHVADAEAARDQAGQCMGALTSRFGFACIREKIETPIEYAPEAFDMVAIYVEWHGKVPLRDVEFLTNLSKRHGAHLSRNAVRGEENARFVTIRDCSKSRLDERVERLSQALTASGYELLKSKKEYCVYDSHKYFDTGWLGDTGEANVELVACEAFIRRAVQIDENFLLKGSHVGRRYFPSPDLRLPRDLDWVYLRTIASNDEANRIFSCWAQAATELQLDDGVVFTSFSENAFWRDIEYAMSDDFPTTNTDIVCVVGGRSVELNVDISFNLPLPQEPVALTFHPSQGAAFSVPKTVPLALQVAWKLHQTIVRPRIKDFYDLAYFLIHPSFDPNARQDALKAFADECRADEIRPTPLLDFVHDRWELLPWPLKGGGERDFANWQVDNKQIWDKFQAPALGESAFSSRSPQDDFYAFKSFVLASCRKAGLADLAERDLLRL